MKATRYPLPLILALAGCSPAEHSAVSTERLHFTDVTAESGIDMLVTCGTEPQTMLVEVKGSGLALIDFDNDGDPDVFFPNGATLDSPTRGPGCRLYENLGGLQFEDVTEQAGLTFRNWSYGAAVGDYDNNGFDDIYITCYGENSLLKNTGDGKFVEVAEAAGVRGNAWSSASAFGDIDNDGDLDLYVVNYVELDIRGPKPGAHFLGAKVLAGPMGLPKVPDRLYENLGDGTFRDISEESGIHQRPAKWGLGVVILDFDGDSRPDIYVGNDSQASFLFRGLGGGKFVEMGVLAGIAFNEDGAGQATMGIAVGDVDGNGLPDLFTTNFMYDTNTLHVNLGDMSFEDRTRRYGLYVDGRPYLSWAAHFADFDHDADEDLVFFNGHIYPEFICDQQNWSYRQPPVLYRRDGERFTRMQPETAGVWLGESHCDRCASTGDFDGDGDLDLLVCERNDQARVLRNDRDGGAWSIVALKDGRPGHDHRGIGSKVVLRAGESQQTRWIVSGVGYLAANQYIAHFGLATGTSTVDLEVTWTDGHVQAVSDVPTKQRFIVERD